MRLHGTGLKLSQLRCSSVLIGQSTGDTEASRLLLGVSQFLCWDVSQEGALMSGQFVGSVNGWRRLHER
jgi:hypothetical protein